MNRNTSMLSLFFCLALFIMGACAEEHENFYAKLDNVQIDIEKILGCSKDKLTLRLVKHPESNRIGVPLHGRKRLIMLTEEEDRKITAETVRQLKNQKAFYSSKGDEMRVDRIATKIIDVLPRKIKKEFYLADTDIVNAFCLNDGTLIVTRGALKAFPDEELAFIIAHEYGHALARHGAESLTKSIETEEIETWVIQRQVKKAEDEGKGKKALLIQGGYFLVANLGVRLPYSRTMENEADTLGIVYMKKAGYDPNGAIEAMSRLQNQEGEESKWEVFLSTHPATSERRKRLQVYAQYNDGSILTEAGEDESDVALDWAYDGMKMLDEICFENFKCEHPQGEIIFIPGIFMKKAENYLPKLKELFPEYNISVLQWKAVSKLSWERSVYRAGMLADYLSRILSTRDRDDLRKTILIGHSLGSQVVLKSFKGLKKEEVKLKQIIIMGSAISFTADELNDCSKVASSPTLNLFKPSDRVLKYEYYYAEKEPALGLMGAPYTVPGILEYRIPEVKDNEASNEGEVDEEVEAGETKNDMEKNEVPEKRIVGIISHFKSHSAFTYFDGLAKIFKGELRPEIVKIDHRTIASPINLPSKIKIALPETGGTLLDSLYDWQLLSYKISLRKFTRTIVVIRNPYGEPCGYGLKNTTVEKDFSDIKEKLERAAKGE